jgi:hypothetical protein
MREFPPSSSLSETGVQSKREYEVEFMFKGLARNEVGSSKWGGKVKM